MKPAEMAAAIDELRAEVAALKAELGGCQDISMQRGRAAVAAVMRRNAAANPPPPPVPLPERDWVCITTVRGDYKTPAIVDRKYERGVLVETKTIAPAEDFTFGGRDFRLAADWAATLKVNEHLVHALEVGKIAVREATREEAQRMERELRMHSENQFIANVEVNRGVFAAAAANMTSVAASNHAKVR